MLADAARFYQSLLGTRRLLVGRAGSGVSCAPKRAPEPPGAPVAAAARHRSLRAAPRRQKLADSRRRLGVSCARRTRQEGCQHVRNVIALSTLSDVILGMQLRWTRVLNSRRGLRLRLARFRPIAIFMILRSLQPKELWSLKFMRPHLSRNLTVAQRIGCAITHYSFEGRNYGPIYHRSVHQSARGLVLWHRVVDGTRYTIALRGTEDTRREGDLSVLCFVNDTRVCRLSFSYVNASLFGLRSARTMFVTRSQTDRNSELQRFRDTFKQNSPPYFCLASVCGIAMANGMRTIFMIKHDAQLGYAERYAEGFRNSYSALWEAFGAQELEDLHAYTMSFPLKLNPLLRVKHKGRAIARRRNWLEVALSARQAMLHERTSRAPPPIGGEACALLPYLADAQAESKAANLEPHLADPLKARGGLMVQSPAGASSGCDAA
jgi:uncharacterized protein VirK/YbjX